VFERFSDRARRVVSLAEVESNALGHQHLGTEHLLLGVLAQAHSAAAEALEGAGATLDGARLKVAEAVGRRPPPTTPGEDLALTARAKRAIGRASRFSLQNREPYVEPEHVLLGVLDVEGTAGQVLRGLGVDVGRLRDGLARRSPPMGSALEPAETSGPERSGAVAADLRESVDPEPEPDAAPARCPACGAPLAGGLACRVMTARQEGGGTRELLVTFCTRCGSAFGAALC
jgi:ATP-dependent Clp protease ATP-binding subunit ClpC